MKKISCKFDPPLEWEQAKELDLEGTVSVTYKTSGGSSYIEGFKCYEKDLEKVASKLKMQKVAFRLDK